MLWRYIIIHSFTLRPVVNPSTFQIIEDQNIKNEFCHLFVWVRNVVSYFDGRT